mmetsp:Transcript_849/g.2391  ORF Transcript_849/g.2391 Transcript_849/m.2391 type:complete len:257 (+) Transcript_849:485-1255(+)
MSGPRLREPVARGPERAPEQAPARAAVALEPRGARVLFTARERVVGRAARLLRQLQKGVLRRVPKALDPAEENGPFRDDTMELQLRGGRPARRADGIPRLSLLRRLRRPLPRRRRRLRLRRRRRRRATLPQLLPPRRPLCRLQPHRLPGLRHPLLLPLRSPLDPRPLRLPRRARRQLRPSGSWPPCSPRWWSRRLGRRRARPKQRLRPHVILSCLLFGWCPFFSLSLLCCVFWEQTLWWLAFSPGRSVVVATSRYT